MSKSPHPNGMESSASHVSSNHWQPEPYDLEQQESHDARVPRRCSRDAVFKDKMRRRVVNWLTQSPAYQEQNQTGHALAAPPDHNLGIQYSNLHFNPHLQLEFADDQLDGFQDEEYKEQDGEHHAFHPPHQDFVQVVLPPSRNVVRRPPRATRYGYRRTSLSIIPEE